MPEPVIYYAPKPYPKRLDEQFHFDSKTAVHNTLNAMLGAIEARLAGLDSLFVTQEQVIDNLVAVGLQRMDEVFTPLINAAVERLNTLGVQFTAPSTSPNTIDLGPKTFTIPSPQRDAFIYGSHVDCRVDSTHSMICTVTSYDRAGGILVLDSILADGVGPTSYTSWTISMTPPPDASHATRTDNPHHVTAEQVDAYTKAAMDAIDAAIYSATCQRGNNLGDVTSFSTARANLGLGTVATRDVGTAPTQVPANANLGTAAYRDAGNAGAQVCLLTGGTAYPGMIPATVAGVGFVPEGRLTLEVGVPIQANRNLGAKSLVNYTPYLGKHVPVFNGSNVMMYPIVSPTDAIGLYFDMGANPYWPANKNFDLFVAYLPATGTIYLGTGPAWQTDTVRGVGAGTSEIEMWHGLPVNKYPFAQFASSHGIDLNVPARNGFWVGTFRTVADGVTRMDLAPPASTGGNHPKLFLWNRYHRLPMTARCQDSTTNWNVPLGSIAIFGSMRAVNNSNNNRVSWCVGEGSSRFIATMNYTVGVHDTFRTHIAYDGTEPAPVGGLVSFGSPPAGQVFSSNLFCEMRRTSDPGFHYVQFAEAAITSSVQVNGPDFVGTLAIDM